MAILTEQQLELAARKYCELAGLDPEKMVAAPTPVDERGFTRDVYIEHRQWLSVALKLREHNLFDEAIRLAL